MHPTSFFIVAVALTIVVSMFVVPAFSISSNQCSSCHGSAYNQQLDILEENNQNSIPTTLEVDQTQSVTVAIQNINNVPMYNQFSSVTLTLSSQNGHFFVHTPVVNIGTLLSTATATWQITGLLQGSDTLVITASATNTHENLHYSDSYLPAPALTVVPDPNPDATPFSTPSPPPSLTIHPSISPTTAPLPTQNLVTGTPIPTPTASPSLTPTTQPSPSPISSTPAPDSEVAQNSTSAHELNSPMLYIHPPLAIIGLILIFLFAVLTFKRNFLERRITKLAGYGLWLFTLLGLLTGMIWAQLAWGSYWSWDPKETMTLTLFLSASVGQIFYFKRNYAATKWVALLTCVLVTLTLLSSFVIKGLH
jgi:hypothetical protein